jgi:hypothetical protein
MSVVLRWESFDLDQEKSFIDHPQGLCDKAQISWYNESKLSLRDTHAKVYEDPKDLWPETIDLEGFKYNLLGN